MRESGLQFTDLLIDRGTWQVIRKPIITLFLLIHLGSFLICLFLPNVVAARLLEPIQRYLAYMSLWQGYGVFSPTPSIRNSHLVAVVTYQDGSIRYFPLQRLDRSSMLEKLSQERFRKYLEDNIPNPACEFLLGDLCRYVARAVDVYKPIKVKGVIKENRPLTVTLIKLYSMIPPIQEKKPNPPHNEAKVLATFAIEKDDLQ
ncbi:MAG: hypothetical protein K2X93_06190 [Candidatus Obscuribacterales bacterium]|nr:hypothetical protein [Candidatus Obscuribacterales bacterium]